MPQSDSENRPSRKQLPEPVALWRGRILSAAPGALGMEPVATRDPHALGNTARPRQMLLATRLLGALGRRARHVTTRQPWTNVYGLARSLLAAATAATLAFNGSDVLFTPASGLDGGPMCDNGV